MWTVAPVSGYSCDVDDLPSATDFSSEVRNSQPFRRRPQVVSELLTAREAATRFGVTDYKLYKWAAEGSLHPVRAPGGLRILYPEWELRELVAAGMPPYRTQVEFSFETGAA